MGIITEWEELRSNLDGGMWGSGSGGGLIGLIGWTSKHNTETQEQENKLQSQSKEYEQNLNYIEIQERNILTQNQTQTKFWHYENSIN